MGKSEEMGVRKEWRALPCLSSEGGNPEFAGWRDCA